MVAAANMVEIAALVGDTARATMLAALLSGQAQNKSRSAASIMMWWLQFTFQVRQDGSAFARSGNLSTGPWVPDNARGLQGVRDMLGQLF
jgi:hypothetical protein